MAAHPQSKVTEVPKGSPLGALATPVVRLQHCVVDLLKRKGQSSAASADLRAILEHCQARTDISDHLPTLFGAALSVNPKLIVELGVRTGESTRVLARVARLCDARLVSVDIDDCSKACDWPGWLFVQGDDVEFAKTFPAWADKKGLPAVVDFLFIDTSHLYDHTVAEIRHWFPLLGPRARVAFHDTNQRRVYFRRDGSVGLGWNNARGVVGALEDYFKATFAERSDFIEQLPGWLIQHEACCSGFTVLTRVPSTEARR